MQTWEADGKIAGLYKRIGATKTVWAVKARIKGGKPVTVTLGSSDLIKVADARRLAIEKLSLMTQGVNPNDVAKEVRQQRIRKQEAEAARGLTLRGALQQYLQLKERKPATVKSYQQTIERNFADWLDRPLRLIDRQAVLDRYQAIKSRVREGKRNSATQFVNSTGEGEAQRAFRYLGAICNSFGNDVVGGEQLLTSNPVAVLKDKKVRQLLRPRQRYLTANQIESLMQEAGNCGHPEWKGVSKPRDFDFIVLLLMTGLRVDELRTLMWRNVDFQEGILRAVDTKNHNEHMLPLTGSVATVLKKLKKDNKSIYVFPSLKNLDQPASMSRTFDRVCADVGFTFTAHDLRRTFATVANEMGIDIVKIGAALNHAKKGVTAGYIQTTPSMLSETLQVVQYAIFQKWLDDAS